MPRRESNPYRSKATRASLSEAQPPNRGRSARLPLYRIMQIHQLMQQKEYPNCQVLSKEFEVSYKTVQRDIDFMRDQLRLPIDYDTVRHGFCYTREVKNLPSLSLQEGEVVALLVAQRAAEQYRGTPFEKSLKTAFSKLVEGLPSRSQISLQDLAQALSFRPHGPPAGDLHSFQMLSAALLSSHEVAFFYRKPGDEERNERRIQPYHLGCIGGQWYLIGLDLARKAVRTFALARITKPKNLKRRFERPKDFSLDELLGRSFSVFESKSPRKVRILLDPLAAALAGERRWHASQKITPRKDGSAELSLNVGLAPDLESWILGWGPRAEVIAPASLRRSIGAALTKAASRYR
jgi:predicted DNA-binding transcriptional regulator YafY